MKYKIQVNDRGEVSLFAQTAHGGKSVWRGGGVFKYGASFEEVAEAIDAVHEVAGIKAEKAKDYAS